MKRRFSLFLLAFGLAACAVQPLTPMPSEGTLPPSPTAPASVIISPTASVTNAPTRVPTITPTYITVFTDATSPTETPTAPPPQNQVPNNPIPTPAAVGPSPAVIVPPTPVVVIAPPSADVAAAEQYCIDLINAQRAAVGVPPLARSEALMSIARGRVADMVTRGYTGHYDPVTGASLGRPQILAAGYARGGENWYGTLHAPPSIVDVAMGWFMTDPPHANNILSVTYTAIGVGIAFNGQQWLLVQNFGG